MAEILLARLVGPMGFERAVVVKRILPHLATDPQFVRMFLDEARLAARISHRNVVQVQELGEHDEELYLVMEYLEGESLASLTRRVARKGARFDPALVAFVIAEAASGLHAAHELLDAAGKPLELVHRDVSPHNVFISYDGTVKVLDFGIATAADRLTRTEAGELKGKFEYMSPEQCAGKTLDRRSDVFSLGTLLWETLTGHRLFRRSNKLLVLKAITDGPIPPPSSIAATVPPALDAVCAKALARSRSERYQSAAEMRRDLVRVARQLAGDGMLDESLRDLMIRLFDDRIDEKRQMLARLQAGSDLTSLPAAEVDRAVELPSVEVELDLDPTTGSSSVGPAPPPDGSRRAGGAHRGARLPWIAAAAAAATVLVVAVVIAAAHEPAATAPVPARPAGRRSTVGARTERAIAGPVTRTRAAPDPASQTATAEVNLRIESTPVPAEVRVGGAAHGTTPLRLRLPRSSDSFDVELRAEGYATEQMTLTADGDQRILVRLTEAVPEPRGERPRPRGRGPAKARKYHRFD